MSMPRAAWLLLLLALGAPLGACTQDDRVLVPRWEVRRAGAAPRTVVLPGRFDRELPHHDPDYRWSGAFAVPDAWRGQPLTRILPSFDGLVTAEVDGVAAATAGLEAPRVYRQPGPHRFLVPAAVTGDGQVEVELLIAHRWSESAAFGAAPRLVRAGHDDFLTWAVWLFNLVVAVGAVVALLQIGVSSAMVYMTDRRRRAYILFGIQGLSAVVYPLHLLGVGQVVIGHLDATLAAVGLVVAIVVSVSFTHAFFELPAPSRWIRHLAAVVVLHCFALSPWPHLFSMIVLPPVVLLLFGLIVYQVVACTRISLSHPDRRSAVYLLVSWLGLGATGVPDMIYWAGLGDPLFGVRTASVGLALFAFWLSLLFSQRHIGSLAVSDVQKAELATRVEQLETNRAEIEQLNAELRRQLTEKSAQIYAALNLAGGSQTSAPRIAPGDRIEDRYRVESRLGSGGMGEVFEVTRLADQRRLALKVTHELSGPALARLAREAQVALKVRHPNVVEVVDVDVASAGYLYIVMELVTGAPLRMRSASGRVDLDWTVGVLAQVARGLSALHDAGIVHRDLKPANIMCTDMQAKPLLKVMDFGVAKELGQGDTDTLTAQGVAIGTPAYIAPEQVSGGGIDPRPHPHPLGRDL